MAFMRNKYGVPGMAAGASYTRIDWMAMTRAAINSTTMNVTGGTISSASSPRLSLVLRSSKGTGTWTTYTAARKVNAGASANAMT